jgi:hypothetical protein
MTGIEIPFACLGQIPGIRLCAIIGRAGRT